MTVSEYVGARYVPLIAQPVEWSKDTAYEPLTIVLHQGNSYTSRQAVPVGIEITNEEYWAVTGNYNAQVEQYRKETERATQIAKSAETKGEQAVEIAAEAKDASAKNLTAINLIKQTAQFVNTASNSAQFQEIVNSDVQNNKISYFSNVTLDETVILPTGAIIVIANCSYTGTDYAFNFSGGSNIRFYAHKFNCPNGGGFDFSANTNMDGGFFAIDECVCYLPVINYTPTGETKSWAQYVEFTGHKWESKTTPVIQMKTMSTQPMTQWFNSVVLRDINFVTANPNAAIDCINRDYETTLFGFDQWSLENLSFEKSYQGMHLYNITAWKARNLRAEETTNYALRIAGFCPNCDFEFSGFIKLKDKNPFIDSNVQGNTCFVKAPIYKAGESYKQEPVVTKMLCGKQVVVPIETNIRTFNSSSGSYTVPSDYSEPQPTYFLISDNYNLNLGNDFYGLNKINELYLYAYGATVTNCFVTVNGVKNTVLRPGHYAITAANKLINISGDTGA